MIKATVKNNLSFPKLTFQEDLKYIGEKIIVPTMQKNIEDQVAIDGSILPFNEDSTLKRKARSGRGSKSLISTGDLISSFRVFAEGLSTIKITLNSNRKDIGKYLQIDGIKSKSGKKFYKFFGINQQMERNAIVYMKKRIKDAIDAFRK